MGSLNSNLRVHPFPQDGGKPRKEAAQGGAETRIARPAACQVIRQTRCAAGPTPLASEKRPHQRLELEFSAWCRLSVADHLLLLSRARQGNPKTR
jgi:hypothetical protein